MIVGELKDLGARSTSLLDGARSDELREKAKNAGTQLLQLAHYAVAVPEAQPERLFGAARRMRQAVAMEPVMDSGASEQAIAASVHESAEGNREALGGTPLARCIRYTRREHSPNCQSYVGERRVQ